MINDKLWKIIEKIIDILLYIILSILFVLFFGSLILAVAIIGGFGP